MVHIRCAHVRCLLVPFSQRRSEISSKLFVTRETHRETETETDIQRDKEADKEAEHLDNSSIRAPSLRQKNIDNPQMRRRKDGEEMMYHFKVCDLRHLHMAGMSTGGLSRSVASVHANLWTSTKRAHRKYITSRQTSPAHCIPASRRGPTDDPQLWTYGPSQGP